MSVAPQDTEAGEYIFASDAIASEAIAAIRDDAPEDISDDVSDDVSDGIPDVLLM